MKRVILSIIMCSYALFLSAGNSEVFPNPAIDNFTVNSSDKINFVEVYNFLGTKVLEATITGESANFINISNLSPGRYFVKVHLEGNKLEVIQLIKK